MLDRERINTAAAAGKPLTDRQGKPRRPLSNESINKTLMLLACILDTAVERGALTSNPAPGRKRRLKVARPARRILETDELAELLDVAGHLDRRRQSTLQIGRRPLIPTLAMAGLRVGELCQLRWRNVDIHHERLTVEQAKTDAGRRQVDITLDLIDELTAWRARSDHTGPDDYVFATRSGRPRDKDNVRTLISRVVIAANRTREERGLPPLPPVVPHTLRRTYISLMLEAGAPLHYVMDQVGHEDSKTTLEIYAKVQKRLSRTEVKRAFDALLAQPTTVPAGPREKMPVYVVERGR